MSLLEKVKAMLGFQPKPKADYVKVDLSNAIQRNEMASERARRALEGLKSDNMAATVRDLAGKM